MFKTRGIRMPFRKLAWVLCAIALTVGLAFVPAYAQAPEAGVARANAGTVGIISGGVDGTYIRIATDLAAVLDDGDRLRVIPVVGKGSLQNIADILYLRGIDIGIVQSDVLAYAKRKQLYPNIDQSIQYITKLYDEEIHVLARPDIASLQDLADKPVNVDVIGSGTAMTAAVLFEGLQISVRTTNNDQATALDKLKRGEIAALVYVSGKPARLFSGIGSDTGLHFLPVPLSAPLLETYLPARFTHADYPQLVSEDAPVDTMAVGSVLATFAWPPGNERYRKVSRFVDAFFGKFQSFMQPPRHPKWKDVNLAAQVPGWTRFAPAQDWLKRQAVAATTDSVQQHEFDGFLARISSPGASLTTAQKDALFREFLLWQSSRSRTQ
jgi:TRAP transporter TAXI family solute receptor